MSMEPDTKESDIGLNSSYDFLQYTYFFRFFEFELADGADAMQQHMVNKIKKGASFITRRPVDGWLCD